MNWTTRIPIGQLKRFAVATLFALCVAPTFISYKPYLFSWDDSDYLVRSIKVSRAFWSGSVHGLSAMSSIRPPAMTLLGIPWGPLASWDAAGKCFITLAGLVSLLAAFCLYLLLRMEVKPLFIVLASICVFASIGPYPGGSIAHLCATAFLSDSLFAWTTLAALLLIPYEARSCSMSLKHAAVRGILWGAIVSLGVMTKINFLYFIVLIVPTLLVITLRNSGLRSALAALTAFAGTSAPAAIYLVRYGRPAFANGAASSFGQLAGFFYVPLLPYLRDSFRESPGLAMSFGLMAAAAAYLLTKRRSFVLRPDSLALVMVIGFAIVVLAAPNRQIRYSFPVIVALPFLLGALMSAKANSVPARSTALASGLVFCGLLAASMPMRHRADRSSLARSDAVLAQAAQCNAKRVLLATDSPTLNQDLMHLAIAVSAPEAPVEVETLAYRAMSGTSVEDDFRVMREADQVIFQDKYALDPAFTNLRAAEYELYVREKEGGVPIRVANDVSVFAVSCKPQVVTKGLSPPASSNRDGPI